MQLTQKQLQCVKNIVHSSTTIQQYTLWHAAMPTQSVVCTYLPSACTYNIWFLYTLCICTYLRTYIHTHLHRYYMHMYRYIRTYTYI